MVSPSEWKRVEALLPAAGAPLESRASLSLLYSRAKTVIMDTSTLIHPDSASSSRKVAPDSIYRAYEKFNSFMHSLGITDYRKSDTWREPLYRHISFQVSGECSSQ